jgi:hypothetical protein
VDTPLSLIEHLFVFVLLYFFIEQFLPPTLQLLIFLFLELFNLPRVEEKLFLFFLRPTHHSNCFELLKVPGVHSTQLHYLNILVLLQDDFPKKSLETLVQLYAKREVNARLLFLRLLHLRGSILSIGLSYHVELPQSQTHLLKYLIGFKSLTIETPFFYFERN